MKLPGTKAAEAGKIIAGRPYSIKSELRTRKILPRETYKQMSGQVVALNKHKAASPTK